MQCQTGWQMAGDGICRLCEDETSVSRSWSWWSGVVGICVLVVVLVVFYLKSKQTVRRKRREYNMIMAELRLRHKMTKDEMYDEVFACARHPLRIEMPGCRQELFCVVGAIPKICNAPLPRIRSQAISWTAALLVARLGRLAT